MELKEWGLLSSDAHGNGRYFAWFFIKALYL